jgi:predicted phosphodiesterase
VDNDALLNAVIAGAKIGVISDVHGNSWALEAVFKHGEASGVRHWINLGDVTWGVLDPTGTVELLQARGVLNIAGNQDREVLDRALPDCSSVSLKFTREFSTAESLNWLAGLPATRRVGEYLFLCHGSPNSDTTYLTETVTALGSMIRPLSEVCELVSCVSQKFILCGHTHLQREVHFPDGQIVLNPGSVGLQAYSDDAPFPHVMESGSPHARYGILQRARHDWKVQMCAVEYDWETAASAANKNGRPDWARQLRTGRVNG